MTKEQDYQEKIMEVALVPPIEQPYQVPKNWVWTRVGIVNEVITGSTPPKKNKAYYDEGDIPFIKPNDLGQGRWLEHATETISEEGLKISREIPSFSTLICCIGSIGKTAFTNFKCATNQQINSLLTYQTIEPLYTYYYCLTPLFQELLKLNSSATTISIINKSRVSKLYYPLPPLTEQQRIVHKLESLIDKINEAKQLIEEARDTFENRRAAILDKAFRGELTSKWRQEHPDVEPAKQLLSRIKAEKEKYTSNCKKNKESFPPIEPPYELPKGWCWSTIGELTNYVGSGITPRGGNSVYLKTGIPFIRSQNVLRCHLNLDDIAYISQEIHHSMKRTQLCGGETLLNITGASIGRCVQLPEEFTPANVNQHVCILRFSEYTDLKLPQFWVNSPILQEILMSTQSGVTRQGLNYEQVKRLPYPVAPLQEQLEIRAKVINLLKMEDNLKETCELDEILEEISQSILSKAFRGELGTNNPEEESAIELLKQILNQKNSFD